MRENNSSSIDNVSEVCEALTCLRNLKQSYETNRIIIGDIEDLVDQIEFIEYCVNKQKRIPTKEMIDTKFFGKPKKIKYCGVCETKVDEGQGYFCPKCGQKFC